MNKQWCFLILAFVGFASQAADANTQAPPVEGGASEFASTFKNGTFTNNTDIYEVNLNESWVFSCLAVIENQSVLLPLKSFSPELLGGLIIDEKNTVLIKNERHLKLPSSMVASRDDDKLILKILLPEDFFKPNVLARQKAHKEEGIPITAFYTNYHLFADVSAIRDMRGLLSSSWMSEDRWAIKNELLWTGKTFSRQETTWKKDFGQHGIQVGDVNNTSLPGFSSMNSLGIKFSSPYFNSIKSQGEYLPPMSISGFAVTPSKIDLFLNNQLIQHNDVAPGKYSLEIPFQTTGYGVFQSYVYDITGKPSVVNFDFYNSLDMVKKGTNEYSITTGKIKRISPEQTVSYDKPMSSFIYKSGVANWLTQDFYFQKSAEYSVASSLTHIIPHPFIGKFSFGASSNSMHQKLNRIGWERRGGKFSFTTDYRKSPNLDTGFCLGFEQECLYKQRQTFFGFALPFNLGNFNIGNVDKTTEKGRIKLSSMFWSKQITKTITFVSSYTNTLIEAENKTNKTLYFGISVNLDKRIYSNTSFSQENGVGSTQQSFFKGEDPRHPEYGAGSLTVKKTGDQQSENLFFGANHDTFAYQFMAFKEPKSFNANIGVDGVFAYIPSEGYVQLSKRINDGLIFVNVENLTEPGEVIHENKFSGKTNSNGKYLITDALAKNSEMVGIDVNKLPNNITLEEHKKQIYIPSSGATKVTFKSKPLPYLVRIKGVESGVMFSIGEEFYVVGDGGLVSVEAEGHADLKYNDKTCPLEISKAVKEYSCENIFK